ncbi:MAG: GNAT family N-acetyltransferase [Acidobacteria bacterium]|nr:GNAT family N-acetyltransferase [Acidobacteriota bacterium]
MERNLREAMRFFCRANESGEARQMPGVLLISSGIDYGVFNSALITEPVPDLPALEQRLLTAQVFFRARGFRWSLWACDDLLDRSVRRKAKSVCERYGLRLLTEPPGMFAERLLPPARPAPAITVRPVNDIETRFAFCRIAASTFELPFAIATEIYTQPGVWESTFHGYLGYAGGTPVSTVATVVDNGIAGVYSVATLPEFRCRGYAETVMRHALNEARREFGVEATVLQSTRSGIRLYQSMGYRTVTRFGVYLGDRA